MSLERASLPPPRPHSPMGGGKAGPTLSPSEPRQWNGDMPGGRHWGIGTPESSHWTGLLTCEAFGTIM